MKKTIIMLAVFLFLAVFIIGCAQKQEIKKEVITEPKINQTQQNASSNVIVNEQKELPKETCEDKAKKLFPEIISLSIPSSYNPNSSGWRLNNDSRWKDGVLIELKGDIEFFKGRSANENINYWYTKNIQNENLYGKGGLKYSKDAISQLGFVGKNIFIIKPILKPIQIVNPTQPFAPYRGTFEIFEPGFINCSWVE
jgi:hypothetical protein